MRVLVPHMGIWTAAAAAVLVMATMICGLHPAMRTARVSCRGLPWKTWGLQARGISATCGVTAEEWLVLPVDCPSELSAAASYLHAMRNSCAPICRSNAVPKDKIVWSKQVGALQVDCVVLEPGFMGTAALTSEENVRNWCREIALRETPVRLQPVTMSLEAELETSKRVVERMSFASRSYQRSHIVLDSHPHLGSKVIDKDGTPVTVVDYSVQAVVLDALHRQFPDDRFIAEEDSSLLRNNTVLAHSVLEFVEASTGEKWSLDRLYDAVDLGAAHADGHAEDLRKGRVWVLDPIDGTEGFIAGKHFCIALALMDNGDPVLSVLGCPNLNLQRVLECRPGKSVTCIDDDLIAHYRKEPADTRDSEPDTQYLSVPDIGCGAVFFAVSGQGAFARSLTMPANAAAQVTVSDKQFDSGSVNRTNRSKRESAVNQMRFAQGMGFGRHRRIERVAQDLGMNGDSMRIHSQCKYCLVGAGAAEATIRWPPAGYREKVWDHVPGAHFVTECGGTVSDLFGERIDFAIGRHLAPSVTGIVASNGPPTQEAIVQAIRNQEKSPAADGIWESMKSYFR